MTSGRRDEIDILRAFAIVTVFAGHFTDTSNKWQEANPPFEYSIIVDKVTLDRLGKARTFGAMFCLQLLFYVSGMTCGLGKKRNLNIFTLILKRSFRLLAPLVVSWFLFLYPLMYMMKGMSPCAPMLHRNIVTGILDFWHIISCTGVEYLWFFIALWIMSIINLPFFSALKNIYEYPSEIIQNKVYMSLIKGLICVCLFILLPIPEYIYSSKSENNINIYNMWFIPLYLIPYIISGVFVGYYSIRYSKKPPGWLSIFINTITIITTIFLAPYAHKMGMSMGMSWLFFNMFYFIGFITMLMLPQTQIWDKNSKFIFYIRLVIGCTIIPIIAVAPFPYKAYYLKFPGGPTASQAVLDIISSWIWVYIIHTIVNTIYIYNTNIKMSGRICKLIESWGLILYVCHWPSMLLFLKYILLPIMIKYTGQLPIIIIFPLTELWVALTSISIVFLLERTPILGHCFGLYGQHLKFLENCENSRSVVVCENVYVCENVCVCQNTCVRQNSCVCESTCVCENLCGDGVECNRHTPLLNIIRHTIRICAIKLFW
eukprot:GHVR01178911.1.p1 GENE.GHVR01178911.1~~GHVR01178911.1.p1  ORF type:complete len:543 (+),score=93.93 GHVR01178911.1:144-1772(+)